MMQAVKAEIGTDGQVRLLEPLILETPHLAVLTILEPLDEETAPPRGSSAALLKFLEKNRLPAESRLTAEEIDAQIREEREAWVGRS